MKSGFKVCTYSFVVPREYDLLREIGKKVPITIRRIYTEEGETYASAFKNAGNPGWWVLAYNIRDLKVSSIFRARGKTRIVYKI